MNLKKLEYVLHLADDALILGHRNSEWCGHGPILEQDIALTNISLDLIGQSRSLYQYAATLYNEHAPQSTTGHLSAHWRKPATEDTLAYLRKEREYLNHLLLEQPNGDWAQTILKQFFFSAYAYLLYDHLRHCRDEMIAAIAEKSLKEVTYHRRWSGEWVVRLGDGTEESKRRILSAIDHLWSYTGELFQATDYENAMVLEIGAPDPATLKEEWQKQVFAVFAQANLPEPSGRWMHQGGKDGRHTEHLGYILADMQYLQRTYPGATW